MVVAIKGTHNSGMYMSQGVRSRDSAILSLFPVSLFTPWVLNQNKNIYQQIEVGVRYFDLRIEYWTKKKDLYIAHSVYGPKLQDIFDQFEKAYRDGLISDKDQIIIEIRCLDDDRSKFNRYFNADKKNRLLSTYVKHIFDYDLDKSRYTTLYTDERDIGALIKARDRWIEKYKDYAGGKFIVYQQIITMNVMTDVLNPFKPNSNVDLSIIADKYLADKRLPNIFDCILYDYV